MYFKVLRVERGQPLMLVQWLGNREWVPQKFLSQNRCHTLVYMWHLIFTTMWAGTQVSIINAAWSWNPRMPAGSILDVRIASCAVCFLQLLSSALQLAGDGAIRGTQNKYPCLHEQQTASVKRGIPMFLSCSSTCPQTKTQLASLILALPALRSVPLKKFFL